MGNCQTWRNEIGAGAVDRCPSAFPVPWDGDLVPSAVVDAPRCGFHLDAARSQVEVEVDVTVDQLDSKVIALHIIRARGERAIFLKQKRDPTIKRRLNLLAARSHAECGVQ